MPSVAILGQDCDAVIALSRVYARSYFSLVLFTTIEEKLSKITKDLTRAYPIDITTYPFEKEDITFRPNWPSDTNTVIYVEHFEVLTSNSNCWKKAQHACETVVALLDMLTTDSEACNLEQVICICPVAGNKHDNSGISASAQKLQKAHFENLRALLKQKGVRLLTVQLNCRSKNGQEKHSFSTVPMQLLAEKIFNAQLQKKKVLKIPSRWLRIKQWFSLGY